MNKKVDINFEKALDELESIQGPAGLRIERDIHFKPIKFSEVAS